MSTPVTSSPTASAVCKATSRLSPVMILSATPISASAAMVSSTPGLGGSKKSKKPSKVISRSSSRV